MELFVTIVNTLKKILNIALIYRLFWVGANTEVFFFPFPYKIDRFSNFCQREKLVEPCLTPTSPLPHNDQNSWRKLIVDSP